MYVEHFRSIDLKIVNKCASSKKNEIFIHCFAYLNAPDVVYAFEQLNPRFYRFCEKMLDYTEIQQQIYSIKLSNENTNEQIRAFFTYFALHEFSRLRSLTYGQAGLMNASRWQDLITSSLPNLIVFRFKFDDHDLNETFRKYHEFQTDFWIKKHRCL